MQGRLLLQRASSPSSYFLEQVCDVTAVYEAVLMGKTSQHAVLVFMHAQRRARERGKDGKEKMKNSMSVVEPVCVWGG